MTGVRKTVRLFLEQMRFERYTVRMWLGILLGLAMFMVQIRQFVEFVYVRGEPVNLLELFMYGVINPQNNMLVILGYLFLLSDAPFVNERTLQLVLRTSKKTWNSSCLLYIVAQAFLYYFVLLLFSMLFIQKYGYWGEIWSIPLTQAARQDILMIFQFNVSFPYWSFMQGHSVIQACGLTLTGSVLYASLLGIILYVGNLGGRYSVGTWLAVFVHFSGYITRKEWNPQWSLQSYASPAENGSFIPLLAGFALLACVSYILIKKMDYCVIDKDV